MKHVTRLTNSQRKKCPIHGKKEGCFASPDGKHWDHFKFTRPNYREQRASYGEDYDGGYERLYADLGKAFKAYYGKSTG